MDVPDKSPLVTTSAGVAERLAFLTPEKQELVKEVEASYRTKLQALVGNKARPTSQDLVNIDNLMMAADTEVAKLLSPEEFERFQLTTSRIAQSMRGTMGDFEMTEQEFRDVFNVKKAFEDKYGRMMGSDADEPEIVMAIADLEKQLRSVMGEQRYTEYAREQGWSTSSLQKIAQEYGIPKETAVKVFDLKPAAQQTAARIQLDNSLTPEQKQQALQAVQRETVLAVASFLGEEAANVYYRQGAWIKNLSGMQPEQTKTR